jgi:hypothetical protein
MGHAVAAGFAGFRILSFGVWPFSAHRQANSWRLAVGRSGLAGFVSAYPVGTGDLRRRFMITVSGGLVGSSLTAILCLAVSGWRIQDSIVGMTGFWSLLTAVLGLLPLRARHAVSDGTRLRMLRRGGPEGDRVAAVHSIIAGTMSGIRPRDWDTGLLAMAVTPDDRSPDAISGHSLRYNWLMDSGRIDDAEQELIWLLTQTQPAPLRASWELQAAWITAFHREDGTAASKWLAAAKKRTRHRPVYAESMAKAALAALERRWMDAHRFMDKALHECDRLADRGSAQAIRDALQALALRIRNAEGAPDRV